MVLGKGTSCHQPPGLVDATVRAGPGRSCAGTLTRLQQLCWFEGSFEVHTVQTVFRLQSSCPKASHTSIPRMPLCSHICTASMLGSLAGLLVTYAPISNPVVRFHRRSPVPNNRSVCVSLRVIHSSLPPLPPRPDKRVQFYRSVLSCLLDWYPDEKQLVCTVPPDAAAVVYVYPRLRELGSWAKLLQGGLAPLACVRLDRLVAGMDSSDFFAEQRENFLKSHGPFMYISVMAVRPDRQGHGLGSALLAFICDRADAAGLHCYIEATSSRNRALYERFGFQLIQAEAPA
ncbi:hypothetical protein Vretifemale_10245 [Volvox reticuliferus]|uniref:N-acetyltransferase domain-containing protein n=1 Tax=Volvox reticuliferus TaxID=1737510 RepID=A0A8J4CGB3_9CHLO|nr:hypothetical protein Vretifemale_10245 [Volvox reticuliferus]